MAEERIGFPYDGTSGSTTASLLADAILSQKTKQCLVSSQLIGFQNNNGTYPQAEVFTTLLQGFPTNGTSFGLLSSGLASQAPGVATTFVSTDIGGPSADGFYDIIRFILTFKLPINPGNLTVDWKFGTEENPTYTYTIPDKFEINVTTSGGTINIAKLPNSTSVNVPNAAPFSNPVTGSSETPLPPYPSPNDVTYNAVTSNIETASVNLDPYAGETITVEFFVADAVDRILDSAAFIDNLRIEGCETSEVPHLAFVLNSFALEELGLSHLTNSEAEKVEFALGTLHTSISPSTSSVAELLSLNSSTRKTLQTIILKEILLGSEVQKVVNLITNPVANF